MSLEVSGERRIRLQVGRQEVTAIVREADRPSPDVIVSYAPGAGSNVADRFGTYLAEALAEAGIASLRFQFPYTEKGQRRPDPPAVTEATWRAALDAAMTMAPGVVASGRSFGGRIASQVVAEGAQVLGLTLFAYPLHPPGQPANRRDQHLPAIHVPTLFCSGTRDAFASPDELRAAAASVPNARVVFLEGADHGFNVPRASGRSRTDVYQEAVATLVGWMGTLHGE